jgi:hypothetical protein
MVTAVSNSAVSARISVNEEVTVCTSISARTEENHEKISHCNPSHCRISKREFSE